MTLTIERLHQHLAPRPMRFYEQVNSTQDIALEWLRQGAPSGAVVICDEQMKGRGRKGRTWHTPPGVALALSVILKPQPAALPHMTMIGALAIAQMIDNVGVQAVTIKWPNDVRINGKKVSGVLPEAIWNGSQLLGVALGMGVNVRVNFDGTELDDIATSVEPAAGRPLDRVTLIAALLERVDYWIQHPSQVYDAWKSRLDTLHQSVTIGEISGYAEDVDQQGRLIVRDENGHLHYITAGDVEANRP